MPMQGNMYEKQARLIVNYSVEVKKGDIVLIQGPSAAEPLIREIYREIIIAGGHPHTNIQLEDFQPIFFMNAKDHQLDYTSPISKYLIETVDCSISILGSFNTRALTNVPPEKLARTAAASREISEIFFRRSASGDLRWNLSPFATSGGSQEANMSRLEYEEMIVKTLLLDKEDPIEEWKQISAKQEKWVKYLDKAKELRFVGDDIDLTMTVNGRKWINCDGKKNLPDGEIFTAPIEDSASGKIRFKFPGVYQGKEIEDVRLVFKDGKVVEARALKGEELLRTIVKTDPGAERIGEIAFGTNPGVTVLTHNMLFDEKMNDTVHLALGMAIAESGGTNKSGIHWDLLAQPSEVYADGKLFWKEGKFIV